MLAPLVNRAAELRRLNAAWQRATEGIPQLLVVWGRRRVGKTFLLSHFAEGKRAVFFGATQQAEAIELRRLTEVSGRDLGDQAAHLAGGGLPTWEAALQFFSAVAQEHPLLVILDEVPCLARSTPGFASIVQVVWDHLRPGTRLVLVLTGSAVGVMEEILGAGGALRGRPTLSLPLAPVDLYRSSRVSSRSSGRRLAASVCGLRRIPASSPAVGCPQIDARQPAPTRLHARWCAPRGRRRHTPRGTLSDRRVCPDPGGHRPRPDPFLPYCR